MPCRPVGITDGAIIGSVCHQDKREARVKEDRLQEGKMRMKSDKNVLAEGRQRRQQGC